MQAGRLGFKFLSSKNGGALVKAMYPGGPAELGGLMLEDEIIALNGVAIENNLNEWLTYFNDDIKELTIFRKGCMHSLTLPEVNRFFYNTYQVKQVKNPNGLQKNALKAWMS